VDMPCFSTLAYWQGLRPESNASWPPGSVLPRTQIYKYTLLAGFQAAFALLLDWTGVKNR
jgi:hypothetical protein